MIAARVFFDGVDLVALVAVFAAGGFGGWKLRGWAGR